MLVNDGGTATQPRAPGHERPHAASAGAARHGRLSAASTAPGADIPCATSARAPGQYCQSAALRAPGHGRPLAITAGVLCRDRLSAALLAPGAVASSAVTAEAPRQHRLSAAPIATVTLPAGQHRPCQEGLPHNPANPRTQTYSFAHQDTASNHTDYSHAALSPRTAGGLQGGQPLLPSPNVGEGPGVRSFTPSPGACSGGGLGRGRRPADPTTHQVQPAIQVPPHPRPCSTAATGLHRHHPSRAPPPRHCGGGRNPRPPAARGDHRGATLCSLCTLWPKGLSGVPPAASSAARAAPPCAPRATTDSRPAPSRRRCGQCVHRPVRACPPPAS